MWIHDASELSFVTLPGRLPYPGHSLTFIVKGTFDIAVDGVASRADEQAPPGPDIADDDVPDELAYPTDFVHRKARTDLILRGTCYPPRRTPRCKVGFTVGPHHRELLVTGDRHWNSGLLRDTPTEPEPFESMPLTWSRSFGGEGFDENPVGLGFVPKKGKVKGASLPNVEDPKAPLQSAKDAPTPAGFGAVSPAWEPRSSGIGSYGWSWFESRSPWFPEDVDPRVFNAAPRSQQVPHGLRGDEEVKLHHLHPDHVDVAFRLPGIAAQVWVDRWTTIPGRRAEQSTEAWESLRREHLRPESVPMTLDTVWIDADELKLVLVWRGDVETHSDEHEDLRMAYIDALPVGESLPAPEVAQRLWAALQGDESAEDDDAALAEPDAPAESKTTKDDEPRDTFDKEFAALEAQAASLIAAQGRSGGTGPGIAEPKIPAAARQAGEAQVALDEAKQRREEIEAAKNRPPRPSAKPHLAAALKRLEQTGSLSDCDLSGLALSGAALQQADLSGCDLTGARLDGANLDEALLSGATLPDHDASGVTMTGTRFDEAFLERARFSGATLEAISFAAANLARADFSGATLRGCWFDGANLDGARFDGAILQDCTFDDAQLNDATMVDSKSTGCSLRGVYADKLRLSGATWRSTDLSEANLVEADLSGADLAGCRFDDAHLPRSRWIDTKAGEVSLTGADLEDADLTGLDAPSADLAHATLRGATFVTARLAGAILRKADLTDADLCGMPPFPRELPGGGSDALSPGRSERDRGRVRPGHDRRGPLERRDPGTDQAGGSVAMIPDDLKELMDRFPNAAKKLDATQVRNLVGQGRSLAGIRLVGGSLAGVDMTGVDLHAATLEGVDLKGAQLTGADLSGATIEDCSLSGARFDGADLTGCEFVNVTAVDTSFREATLVGTEFRAAASFPPDVVRPGPDGQPQLETPPLERLIPGQASLVGTRWAGATLTGVVFEEARLDAADFGGAAFVGGHWKDVDAKAVNLDGATFDGTTLRGVCFHGATLTELTCVATKFARVDWVDAKLSFKAWKAAIFEDLTFPDGVVWPQDLAGCRVVACGCPQLDLGGRNLVATEFANCDLVGCRIAGANLEETRFDECNLSEADLSGCDLGAVVFAGCDLSAVRLSGAKVRGLRLGGSTVARLDLTRLDLSGADLSELDLGGTSFAGSDLTGATLAGARLAGANFTGARLHQTSMSGCDLAAASFRGATEIVECDLSDADLSGADLGAALWTSCVLTSPTFKAARAEEASFHACDLSELDLAGLSGAGRRLTECSLSKADLTEADLAGADLTDADLAEAKLDGAILSGVIAKGVSLKDARLTDARLDKADLEGATLTGAVLDRADLRQSNLYGAALDTARLGRARLDNARLGTADLADADLSGASLRGADLFGANLRGIVDRGADWSDSITEKNHRNDEVLDAVEAWKPPAHLRG